MVSVNLFYVIPAKAGIGSGQCGRKPTKNYLISKTKIFIFFDKKIIRDKS